FESLADGQAYLDHWDTRWADTRIHGTTKRQVAAMFAEEQPTLRPLPLTPFRYYQYGTRTVHLNGCVEVEGAYYSAPPGHVGERLPVQWDGVTVRLLDPRTGQLLREHRWQAHGQYRIPPEDRPPRTPPEVARLLARTARAGRAIGTLCTTIHQQDGRSASGASSASSRSPSAMASRPSRLPARRPSSAASRPTASSAATASA